MSRHFDIQFRWFLISSLSWPSQLSMPSQKPHHDKPGTQPETLARGLPDQVTSSPDPECSISSRRTSSKSLIVDAMSALDPVADLRPLLCSIRLGPCVHHRLLFPQIRMLHYTLHTRGASRSEERGCAVNDNIYNIPGLGPYIITCGATQTVG